MPLQDVRHFKLVARPGADDDGPAASIGRVDYAAVSWVSTESKEVLKVFLAVL